MFCRFILSRQIGGDEPWRLVVGAVCVCLCVLSPGISEFAGNEINLGIIQLYKLRGASPRCDYEDGISTNGII